eukprot:5948135-Pyramimonas_sp.AAC.1
MGGEEVADERNMTAVVGHPDSLGSLEAANAWPRDRLSSRQGPPPAMIYSQGNGCPGQRDAAMDDLTKAG